MAAPPECREEVSLNRSRIPGIPNSLVSGPGSSLDEADLGCCARVLDPRFTGKESI